MSSDTLNDLHALAGGDEQAVERLWPVVYEQLRRLAGGYLRNHPANHTLQPTALVHEAFVQLVSGKPVSCEDRAHFLALAAVAMRGIVVDCARKRSAAKRGGDWQRVSLSDPRLSGDDTVDAMDIDNAMKRLAELNPRQARIAELRFFGGMTVNEVADVMGISKSTIEEQWRFARAWLSAHLKDDPTA